MSDPVPRRNLRVVAAFLGSIEGPTEPVLPVACTHSKGIAVTADGHQKHILVVNDTQEILDLMQELLEDEGYHVTTSLAFLDMGKLKTLAPDLIVQDLLFEQTQEQGWKFLTLVRLDPELARIPLILCTAAVQTVKEPEMAEQLDRLGVRVVLKPFLIEDLLTAIAGALTAQTLIDQATVVPASDGHGPAETLGETIGGDAVADDASER